MRMLIYALTDEHGAPRYVGQTVRSAQRRYREHLRETQADTYKNHWIKSMQSRGLTPGLLILEDNILDADTLDKREVYWITQYSNLTNATSGGNAGKVSSLEAKAALSKTTLELYKDPIYKQKVVGSSLAARGIAPLKDIACVICGTLFHPRRAIRQTCSRSCGWQLAAQKNTGQRRANFDKQSCVGCEKLYVPERKGTKFCSRSCYEKSGRVSR